MRISRTAWPDAPAEACVGIGGGEDPIVTVTDEECAAYCLGEGRGGLCTARFRSDLLVDELRFPKAGSRLTCGEVTFEMTDRKKRCHGGCALDPAGCRLSGRVLFLKVITPGRVCIGDRLESESDPDEKPMKKTQSLKI